MSNDELDERVRELIYDADPEIPAAAVVAAVREAIAAEIEALHNAVTIEPENPALSLAARGAYRRAARLVRRGEQQ